MGVRLHHQRDGPDRQGRVQSRLDLPRQQGRAEHGGGCGAAQLPEGRLWWRINPGWVRTDHGRGRRAAARGAQRRRMRQTLAEPHAPRTRALFLQLRRPPASVSVMRAGRPSRTCSHAADPRPGNDPRRRARFRARAALAPCAALGQGAPLSGRGAPGLAALGAYGICVPEEFGGADLDYVTLALVLEEIAAGDGGTSTAISVTNCPVNAILMRYGNAAQKKRWLHAAGAGRACWACSA